MCQRLLAKTIEHEQEVDVGLGVMLSRCSLDPEAETSVDLVRKVFIEQNGDLAGKR